MCLAKEMLLGSFPGYAFGSGFSERCTQQQRRTHRHRNTDGFELEQSPLSHCDIINRAGGIPVGSSFGARQILQQSCVTQEARQAVQQGWQPANESSRAGRSYWQDTGEQLWVKPEGLLKGTSGMFKSIKNRAETAEECSVGSWWQKYIQPVTD